MPPAEAAIDARFGTRVYRARTYRTFLEVMNNGVSKGNALKVALKLRGVDCADCVAFGDAENDGPLLEAAGWGGMSLLRSLIWDTRTSLRTQSITSGLVGFTVWSRTIRSSTS
jgi:hypothetical protein